MQKVEIDRIKQKTLELCWKIEALPASEAQTEISIMASDLYSEIALIAAELDRPAKSGDAKRTHFVSLESRGQST